MGHFVLSDTISQVFVFCREMSWTEAEFHAKKTFPATHLDIRLVSGSFYGSGVLSSKNNPKKIPLQLEKLQLLLW